MGWMGSPPAGGRPFAGVRWLPMGGSWAHEPALVQGWLLGCGVLVGFSARLVGGASYTIPTARNSTPRRCAGGGWGGGSSLGGWARPAGRMSPRCG
jgi:hypothetical protein